MTDTQTADGGVIKPRKRKLNRKPSTMQILVLGYLAIILLGTFFLCLPISAKNGGWTAFIDSLLVATSATCVTGLITVDTFLHWTTFGQVVIILLIQIGGLGFMTFVTLFSLALGRRIGLFERGLIAQSAGAFGKGGILRLIKRILIFTFSVELLGACILMTRFVPEFGGQGVWFAFFHSISAFCNAGFDLMGVKGTEFASLTSYSDDWVVNLTICALILVGGMGYVVWSDIWDKRFRYRQYRLHTRIVLWSAVILVFLPALLIFAFEQGGSVLEGKGPAESFLICLFQAVTPRTAGFNTVPIAELSDSSILLIQILMFIGGNSGSTAGGVKVTTMVVILFGLYSSVRGHKDIVIGKRSLDLSLAKQAMSLFTIYLILTTGITPLLHTASKFIITLLMFSGRLGVLTLASAMMTSKVQPLTKRPTEKILIG